MHSITWNAIKGSATEIEKDKVASPFYEILPQISSITFGNKVEYIPSYLCSGMNNLQSVIIPKSVSVIHEYAFWNCGSLSNITILGNIDKIHENAFGHIAKSPKVTFLGKVDYMWGMFGTWNIYTPYYETLTFYVPTEYINYYKSQKKQMVLQKKVKIKFTIKT